MKIKITLILFFLVSFFAFKATDAFAKLDPYRPDCVGIDGKFIVDNWKGGAIQVGCAGDAGANLPKNSTRRCDGEIQTVRPGQSFRLTQCSCFGKKQGCLVVGKELRKEPLVNGKKLITVVKAIKDTNAFKNNSCTINKTNNVCGSNGQKIKGNVKITCNAPVTKTPTPTPTPITVTPTTITPTPSICPVPGQVLNVKVTCPECEAKANAIQ